MDARGWPPGRWLCPPGIVLLAFASLLSCLLPSGQAKIYSRWVCLAYYTSGFNTAAVDHEADGSTNNGIFQVNSRKWCQNLDAEAPNLCQMYCSDLLNPNLKNAVICAMKITQEPRGMGSWEAWRHHCQGKDLRDWVDGCDF
ncbi:sperm acrosome membrane-associated protein 3 isoform X3 [Equus quagga]|uniref:sperm acrosome membrane-associated protein 3 isoform X3 n=1 Tax=Equus quagga TaxID=89248 RepID=UPI001EE1901E|nr:sperm acrosome membrane-associated protein 3 isoform X3 [Equus quagga]